MGKSGKKKEKNELFLNRKEYEKVRKLDHADMAKWAQGVYDIAFKMGLKKGVKEAEKELLTLKDVEDALLCVKGIGTQRASEVLAVLQSGSDSKE